MIVLRGYDPSGMDQYSDAATQAGAAAGAAQDQSSFWSGLGTGVGSFLSSLIGSGGKRQLQPPYMPPPKPDYTPYLLLGAAGIGAYFFFRKR